MKRSVWSKTFVGVGLVAMLLGAIDPLEGSIVILGGMIMVAVGGLIGGSRHRKLLIGSLVLVAAGVGAMWVLSALGGVGGTTGRSYWWALVLAPYPVGWVMGIIGAIRRLREGSRTAAKADAQ